jgi:hypothetical protein
MPIPTGFQQVILKPVAVSLAPAGSSGPGESSYGLNLHSETEVDERFPKL